MVQPLHSYVVDPDDPRAPPQDIWARMTPDERTRVVEELPAKVPFDVMAPEGDAHRKGKNSAVDALSRFFQRIGRKVYLSSELAVYYPSAPRIVPDVLAVLDVELHERMKWVVQTEGKGIDFVLEVHVANDYHKDHEDNVRRYATLGIQEYFLYDRGRHILHGYRLVRQGPTSAHVQSYQRLVPQAGRLRSDVLGLDLVLEGKSLRFFHGTAPLLEADDLISKLSSMVDDLVLKKEQAERDKEQAERDKEQAERDKEQAERALEEERQQAALKIAELTAEIERLKSRQ